MIQSFNKTLPYLMHIDLNSCFATIEQQANPLLRNRPIAVAAYAKDYGCVLAPSVEAKKLGIKVGTRVRDAKQICPEIIILEPDPAKYRYAHKQLSQILNVYTNEVFPKSIDEFVVDFTKSPKYKNKIVDVGRSIKKEIKNVLGEYVTVSVGIGPNRFLAKTAAGLHKPDGLDVIDSTNFLQIYQNLELTDLCGIARQNALRLNMHGIFTVLDFYNASVYDLRRAFKSVLGAYWFQRLRGFEVDDVEFDRKSFNNSYVCPPKIRTREQVLPILAKLVEKMSFRMRSSGFKARGLHVSIAFRDFSHTYWHKGWTYKTLLYSPSDIYSEIFKTLRECPKFEREDVLHLSVTCFGLQKDEIRQLNLFNDEIRKENIVQALDNINSKWGNFVVSPAFMLTAKDHVKDRVAFGRAGL